MMFLSYTASPIQAAHPALSSPRLHSPCADILCDKHYSVVGADSISPQWLTVREGIYHSFWGTLKQILPPNQLWLVLSQGEHSQQWHVSPGKIGTWTKENCFKMSPPIDREEPTDTGEAETQVWITPHFTHRTQSHGVLILRLAGWMLETSSY